MTRIRQQRLFARATRALGLLAGLGVASVSLAFAPNARAAATSSRSNTSNTSNTSGTSSTSSTNKKNPHAFITLETPASKVWAGQAIPITLRAYFHEVEGVTVEGNPQVTSPSVFTYQLAHEPTQATQIVASEPTLVVTWTGTVTPTSSEPLALVAELPVHFRYRDAAPRIEPTNPFGDDPFGDPTQDPFDPTFMDRFLKQTTMQPLGRLHEETVALHASAKTIDVSALPIVDRPASFGGAIGRFQLQTSLSSSNVHVSDPVTLRVVVEGDGDLDRVDIPGVATSDAWKAYPPKASIEIPTTGKGARPRKIFEQVLVPKQGGALHVPGVSLTAFDPKDGRYVTQTSMELPITVDGPTESPSQSDLPRVEATAPRAPSANPASAAAPSIPQTIRATRVMAWLTPFALLAIVAAIVARVFRRRAARRLERTMRGAATRGEPIRFYQAARALIEAKLAGRWGLPRGEVNATLIRHRLGSKGEPLAEALLADDSLRFGRGRLDAANLVPLCDSIERTISGALGGVS